MKADVAMKKGLILEGGAMRGMFSAGVMDVLMENRICFDAVIGVSAGAAFGCNYKSGQIGRALRYNMEYCGDKRYCGMRSLLRTGNLYSTEFAYGEVPLHRDPFDFEAYRVNPMEFYVVCTDIESGEAVYHRYEGWEDHGFDWIRASASLPLVSRIVEIDGRKLLDGGIVDSIPLHFFEEQGFERKLVVLTQPKTYRKEKNKALPLIRAKYRHYPKLVEAMENRHLAYNAMMEQVHAKADRGELLCIFPEEPLPLQRIERKPENLKAAYEIGRAAAQARLEEIRQYLDT